MSSTDQDKQYSNAGAEMIGTYLKFYPLLARYNSLWIWTLFFGATSTLTYSFSGYRLDKWGILALLPLTIQLMGSVLTFLAWGTLTAAFVTILSDLTSAEELIYSSSPETVPEKQNENGNEISVNEKKTTLMIEKNTRKSERLLRCLILIVAASATRMLLGCVDIAYQALLR